MAWSARSGSDRRACAVRFMAWCRSRKPSSATAARRAPLSRKWRYGAVWETPARRAAQAHRSNPLRALQAMAVGVVRFAAAHPSHYRLMSGPAVRGRDHPTLREAAMAAWQTLGEAVVACQRARRMRAGDPMPLAFAMWCLAHGLSVLLVDEQIPPSVLAQYPVERLAEYVTKLFSQGLERSR